MKVIYDPDTDTIDLIFKDEPVAESDEIAPGIIVDYNHAGKIVSVEVLNASEHVDNPRSIAYELKKQKKVS
ncbi:MAG: DUF2283 domain-containing protein [Dehalococcoidia bacterium]|nr:DUF2283 domain-containing protein [Dehalococcoidia bacterium]